MYSRKLEVIINNEKLILDVNIYANDNRHNTNFDIDFKGRKYFVTLKTAKAEYVNNVVAQLQIQEESKNIKFCDVVSEINKNLPEHMVKSFSISSINNKNNILVCIINTERIDYSVIVEVIEVILNKEDKTNDELINFSIDEVLDEVTYLGIYPPISGSTYKTNKKVYNKLVRDKIPYFINDNESAKYRILKSEEYLPALLNKLDEEIAELKVAIENKDNENFVEETADVYEVLSALIKFHGNKQIDVSQVKAEKNKKLGGFDKGVFLIETEKL